MEELRLKKFHPELVEEAEDIEESAFRGCETLAHEELIQKKEWSRVNLFLLKHAMKRLVEPGYKYVSKSRTANKLLGLVEMMLETDGASRISVGIMSTFFGAAKDTRQIYLFQDEFFHAFTKVKLESLTYEHIPKNAVGYVAFPSQLEDGHGHKFSGFYFYCGPVGRVIYDNKNLFTPKPGEYKYPISDLCMAFAYVDTNAESFNYAFRMRPLDETMTVRESWQHSLWTEVDNFMRYKHIEVEEGYTIKEALFSNTLVYLTSGDPDLREFRNKLTYRSPTSTKAVRADSDLSREDVTLLGFNYKKSPLYGKDAWGVETHPRWQPCGERRTKVKLIWVKPHIRHRRAGIEHADDQIIHTEIQDQNAARVDRPESELGP